MHDAKTQMIKNTFFCTQNRVLIVTIIKGKGENL